MKSKPLLIVTLFISFFIISCGGDSYTPKPKGYFRIDLPKHQYKPIERDCPFTFEMSELGEIIQNANNPDKPCWFNIEYPQLNASIYLSYKAINDSLLPKYLEDSRTLAFKHTIKAIDIEQRILNFPDRKVYGIVYDIKGDAASSYQFHFTDSVNHFMRGSLYFNNIPNQDSIQPVLDYVIQDIEHIYETFEWKGNEGGND